MARFKTNSEKNLISKEFNEIKKQYDEQIKSLENKLASLNAEYETLKVSEKKAIGEDEKMFLEISDALRRNGSLKEFYSYKLTKVKKSGVFTDQQKQNLVSRIVKEKKRIEEETLREVVPQLMEVKEKTQKARSDLMDLLNMKSILTGDSPSLVSNPINNVRNQFDSFMFTELFKTYGEGQ